MSRNQRIAEQCNAQYQVAKWAPSIPDEMAQPPSEPTAFRWRLLGFLAICVSVRWWPFLIAGIVALLWDYYLYRRFTKQRAVYQSRVLQSFFQEGGKVKDFDYEEKLPIGVDPGATGKDPTRNLGNALHYIRQSIVLKELRHYTPRGTPSVYLDVGCSDGSLIGLQAVIELGGFLGSFAYIGSDLRYTACKQFCQTTGQSTFQADASTAMPVHEATIDCIIFVEILEHVEDPLAAMQEISRVLKPGGRLIIATGNRHGVGLGHCLSPIIVLEKMLALVVDDLLPPRYMLEDLGGIPCWHTEFSRAEMIALGKACGFHIVSMAGYHYLPGVERYVERICRSRLHVRKYARIINAIETVWRLIPVVKLLGEHWYVVMEKADQGK